MRVDTPWRARAIGGVTRTKWSPENSGRFTSALRLECLVLRAGNRKLQAASTSTQRIGSGMPRWRPRTDAVHVLTDRFGKLPKEDSRVPHTLRSDLRQRLDELRRWRSALRQGAWCAPDSTKASSAPIPDDIRADVLDQKIRETAGSTSKARLGATATASR